ncbi:MAG: deoxyribonuclease IV [Tissierellia bacterium]|nr:deoxyribonuclease IV [Tissierellia bacterium]
MDQEIILGCHLSISKGFKAAAEIANSIGANTFQFFTRNPRGGRAKALDPKDIKGLKQIMSENNFGPLSAHGSYTMNLCSNKEDVRDFASRIIIDDMLRLRELPENTVYVFHPGSHVGQGVEEGIEYIIRGLKDAVDVYPEANIALEGMTGKGSEIGFKFEHIKNIIDGVGKGNLGICLDTCHLYSAGYDIVNDLEGVISEIDDTIGKERIMAVHLNDSMTEMGSNKDRHEKLGEGSIGIDALVRFASHPALKGRPINLETPNEIDGYEREIKLVRELIRKSC